MPRQILTIELDGLTAGDYLAHVADPDPSALGRELRSVTLRAEPLASTVEALLVWDAAVPSEPCAAATAAGLPVVGEAVSLRSRVVDAIPATDVPRGGRRPRRRGLALRIVERLSAPRPAPARA